MTLSFSMVSAGYGIWHIEYLTEGNISRTYCNKKLRNPIAANVTFMSQSAVCKECAKLAVDFIKQKEEI
jgi:hypothetical protein